MFDVDPGRDTEWWMAVRRTLVHSPRFMYALAPKRCTRCSRIVATVSLDRAQGFGLRAAAVLCDQCDGVPDPRDTLHLPDNWD
jgi:hypothetical protein